MDEQLLLEMLMRAGAIPTSASGTGGGLLGGPNARIGAAPPNTSEPNSAALGAMFGRPNAMPLPRSAPQLPGSPQGAALGAMFGMPGGQPNQRPAAPGPALPSLMGGPNASIGAGQGRRMPLPNSVTADSMQSPIAAALGAAYGRPNAMPRPRGPAQPSGAPMSAGLGAMFGTGGQSTAPVTPTLPAAPPMRTTQGPGRMMGNQDTIMSNPAWDKQDMDTNPELMTARPMATNGQELPYQTYERLTGQRWTGGLSQPVLKLLQDFGIQEEPGTAAANMALQRALLGQ